MGNTAEWVDVAPYEGTYKLSGRVTSSGTTTKGVFIGKSTGVAMVAGRNGEVKERQVTSSQTVHFTIDNVAQTLVSKDVSSGSVAGLGAKTGVVQVDGPIPLSNWLQGDGASTLTMNLTTVAKRVAGTAVVTLTSGREFQFAVTGAFRAANGKSTLNLAGFDAAKGSHLAVKMEGNSVASVKGAVSGQLVKINY